MAELFILDVGHGNCSILLEGDTCMIVDAPRGKELPLFLEKRGVKRIETIIISHADDDHISGLSNLLNSRKYNIGEVHVNQVGPIKSGRLRELQLTINDLQKQQRNQGAPSTIFHAYVAQGTSVTTSFNNVSIEVLSPRTADVLSGVGGKGVEGHLLTRNSLSATVRVLFQGTPKALLPGDLDENGLIGLRQFNTEARAHLLVFPHHGGSPGSTNEVLFARELCNLVKPAVIIFSHGRGRHNNPTPDIVSEAKSVLPQAHIICTQLSKNCSATIPQKPPSHLLQPSRGDKHVEGNACCGGTICFDISNDTYSPPRSLHLQYVRSEVSNGICIR